MPQAPSFEPFEYVLREERDLPEEKQTRFLLRPLKFSEWESIQKRKVALVKSVDQDGRLSDETHFDLDQGSLARKVLNWGLVGWENFPGAPDLHRVKENGREIVPDQMLDLVTPWANELANAITERVQVSEESAKNS